MVFDANYPYMGREKKESPEESGFKVKGRKEVARIYLARNFREFFRIMKTLEKVLCETNKWDFEFRRQKLIILERGIY